MDFILEAYHLEEHLTTPAQPLSILWFPSYSCWFSFLGTKKVELEKKNMTTTAFSGLDGQKFEWFALWEAKHSFETLRCINLFKKMRSSSEYAGGDKHKLIRELFGDNLRLDAGFVQNMYYLSCTYMYTLNQLISSFEYNKPCKQ